ncbi:DUF6884 domain-containing protein [Streptomyces sp. NPDC057638]|uniref:DUF6884 domain-containing protein n=1 Tax=Streptomyces sp. NPDC057638 TaxID=3346190 RepID=UPI00369528C7
MDHHNLSPTGKKIILASADGRVDGHGAALDRLVAAKLVVRNPDGTRTLTAAGRALRTTLVNGAVPGQPVTAVPRLTGPQRKALLAGALDPRGRLPKTVNLRVAVRLAELGYVSLDPLNRQEGQEPTREALDAHGGYLTPAGWERARAEGAGAYRIVIIGCGKGKLDHPARAGVMYTGDFHWLCRQTAEELITTGGRIYVASGLHGLLDLDTEIQPYDVRLGDPGSVTADDIRAQVQARAVSDARVTVLAGKRYTALMRAAWAGLEAPLEGSRGIGEMKSRLSRIRSSAQDARWSSRR